MRDFEQISRSTVHATNGMVATSHPLASAEALQILRKGGNAIDAAVAACAVQSVVEPGSTGIGGDCFAMLALEGHGRPIAYNGSGRSPAAAHYDLYVENGVHQIERHSPHAVTVPGAVEAWCRLVADYGSLSLDEILAPAIRLAREGYAISPRVHWDWQQSQALLRIHPETRDLFLPRDRPPPVGTRHWQPQLAATLERIVQHGSRGFYEGPVAEELVTVLRKLGGLHTLRDFARTRGEYVSPISTHFHGYDVYECPPNGQGIIALMLLDLLATPGPVRTSPLAPQRLHRFIAGCRLAYAARDEWLADPTCMKAAVEELLDPRYMDPIREKLHRAGACSGPTSPPAQVAGNTVYIAVVDHDGNAVSFINSLFLHFGSGILAPESGVLLNNRGQGFTMDREHPNRMDGGKRPLNTIIPGLLTRGGRAVMPFGVMGGHYQAAGHYYFLSNLLEYGLDLQESMELPRLFPILGTDLVETESTFSSQVLDDLRRLGHGTQPAPRPIGGSQAIWIDQASGTLTGASDHRKDGCALGY